MATTTGKGKNKKTKGVKVPLQILLAEDSNAPQGFNVVNTRKLDWAESMENEEIDDTFTLNFRRDPTKVLLPTAPKSTRGPDIDLSKVPSQPPFKAYLGNLPYDVTDHDISRYFSKLNIIDVRLPQQNGRARGFAYAEFNDRQSLIDALTYNGDMFRNRQLRVGLPGDNENTTRENTREERQDRTAGDWRAAPREDQNNATRDSTRDTYQPRNGSNDYSSYSDKNMQRGGGYNRNRYENDRTFEPSNDRGFDRSEDKGYERFNDRGFERSNDRVFERSNDRGYDRPNDRGFERPNNRFGNRNNRSNDRNYPGVDRYESGHDDGHNRDHGFDRHEPNDRQYGRRFEDRRFADQNDRRGDRNFNDRRNDRRDYGNFDRKRDDSRFNPSPPPHQESAEEQPKERRKLQLIPRSKPLEESAATPAVTSAIFGGAKPVDTASKEKEIEQKLLKEKEENDRKRETAANAGLGSNERIRRISAGSNVSGTSRSRKGSDSGPPLSHREDSRDYDDSYRNNGMHRNSFNRQRKTSDRSNNSSDNAPKYIMTRGKDSSQGSRYLPLNQRPQGGGGGGGSRAAINSGSNRYNNNNRRRDRDRDRDERYDQKPPRLQNRSDEEEEKKVAYTSTNKFAHLSNEDYDDEDDGVRAASD